MRFFFLQEKVRGTLDREAIIKFQFQREGVGGGVGRRELRADQRGFIEVWGHNRAFTNQKGYFSQIRSTYFDRPRFCRRNSPSNRVKKLRSKRKNE